MTSSDLSQNPIGIFDSGIGGLTVANAIHKHLPKENFIYFGDTAHLPYGDKSADAIRYYSIKISKFLLDQGCKMIVIACNSASSASYEILLDFFKDRALFVNVVDPLVDHVIANKYDKVGVIATKATTNSNVYKSKIESKDPSIAVAQLATPLLVPMIEEGFHHDNISQSIIRKYLSDPSLNDIQALLLACTHYPLIKNQIEDYFDHKIDVLDSTDVVLLRIKDLLDKHKLYNHGEVKDPLFYVSDYTKSFEETTNVFYTQKVSLIEKSIW